MERLRQRDHHGQPARRSQRDRQRTVLRSVLAVDWRARASSEGHCHARQLAGRLRHPGLRHRQRRGQPSLLRHRHSRRTVNLHLDHHLVRPSRLQTPGSSNRVAAVWYAATSFTIAVNLTDGQAHDIALYALDWDSEGRGEQIQISSAATGTILDTETISNFSSGVYLQWKVSGNVIFKVSRSPVANADRQRAVLRPALVGSGAAIVADAKHRRA